MTTFILFSSIDIRKERERRRDGKLKIIQQLFQICVCETTKISLLFLPVIIFSPFFIHSSMHGDDSWGSSIKVWNVYSLEDDKHLNSLHICGFENYEFAVLYCPVFFYLVPKNIPKSKNFIIFRFSFFAALFSYCTSEFRCHHIVKCLGKWDNESHKNSNLSSSYMDAVFCCFDAKKNRNFMLILIHIAVLCVSCELVFIHKSLNSQRVDVEQATGVLCGVFHMPAIYWTFQEKSETRTSFDCRIHHRV